MAGNPLGVSAAILAGGFGTRLRPVVADRPKVLAPVHGRPYLTILFDQLAAAAIEEVTLLTGFQGRQVREALGETYAGMRLLYSEEPFPLGTAGAVRWRLPKLLAPTLLLLNGDSYCPVDFAAFRDFHERTAAQVSVVLARAPGATRYGSVWVNDQGQVKRFAEKAAASTDWINAGIYLLERPLLETIPAGQPLSLERELLPEWVDHGRVFGFRCGGRFLDIGTPEAYAEAGLFFSPPYAHYAA
jgi:D-glycero-alpha-D-manno-heptose 1-phosphate guanylyltransferase